MIGEHACEVYVYTRDAEPRWTLCGEWRDQSIAGAMRIARDAIACGDRATIYLSVAWEVLVSTDAGETWGRQAKDVPLRTYGPPEDLAWGADIVGFHSKERDE